MENRRKNGRSDGATSKRPTETKLSRQTKDVPNSQCITDTPRRQVIETLLPRGKENAVNSKVLARIAGCSSVRVLQALVAAERQTGALILSSTSGGYYLPDEGIKGQQEIAEFYRTLHARAINILRTLRAAKGALQEMDGQFALEELTDE